jgi:uracil-DNA glycosylase
MQWDKFASLFHESWHNKIKPFIESEKCDKIYAFLKYEGQRGKKIAPSSMHTFRAFLETPYDEVKVVLLSYCPYHTFIQGVSVADGLAFSCGVTNKLQPSLEKFYEGVECDLNKCLNLNYTKNPDLTYLAKQGVLLFNCALTVEANKAGSHQTIWEPFTKYVLEECLAYTGIPIVFIGKDAQRYRKYVTPLTHGYIFEVEHPAYAARTEAIWETEGVFSKINTLIRQSNGFEINWLNEQKDGDEVPF